MSRKMGLLILGFCLVFGLVACQKAEAKEETVAPIDESSVPGKVLTLGEVSSDPAKKFEEIEPMVAYLTEHLAEAGITKVEVVVTTDLEEMLIHLKSGEVDLFFDHPYIALEAHEKVGVNFLLRRWRKGVSEYHSKLLVKGAGDVSDLEALAGQMLAFDKPGSSTGDLAPRAYLASQGYKLSQKPEAGSPVAADEIGYVYAGSDDNILTWVLEGKTVGGVYSGDDFDRLDDDLKSQFVVLAQTPDIPRHIVMARPGLDKELEAKVVSILTHMHETPEGQAALKGFGKTDRFDALPLGPEGTLAMLQEMSAPLR